MFKFLRRLFVLSVFVCPAYADSGLTQQELAQRIYDLSFFERAPNERSNYSWSHVGNLNAKHHITVDDCKVVFATYNESDVAGLYLERELTADIYYLPFAPIVDGITLLPGEVYLHSSYDTPTGRSSITHLNFEQLGNAQMRISAKSADDVAIDEADREMIIFTKEPGDHLFQLFSLESEDHVIQLVAAYTEYRERFCSPNS